MIKHSGGTSTLNLIPWGHGLDIVRHIGQLVKPIAWDYYKTSIQLQRVDDMNTLDSSHYNKQYFEKRVI